ncbi:hypothetical protein FRC02_008795 [Tulasnella sp. 418]|nr:hypothetical protein FRC02_008795 [Tulasnella sp. 418]
MSVLAGDRPFDEPIDRQSMDGFGHALPEHSVGASPSHDDDDDEHNMAQGEDANMDDLFGDDDDEKGGDLESSPTPPLPDDAELSAAERSRRKAMEYEEDDAEQEQEVLPAVIAQLSIPNLPPPRSSDKTHWIIRMPNFVKLDTKPFHPDTYTGPEGDYDDPAQGLNMRERSMSIKLEVENTLRWRWVKGADGQMRRQSNSRIIRWSDGSMSLQLGKEIFDISANVDTPASGPTRAASNSQIPTANPGTISRNQDLTYLVAQHKRAEVLQSEAVISGTLSLRPTGMQSETHRKLVKAVGQKHSKVTRLMLAPDPTRESELERMEQLKASKKAASKRRKVQDGDDMGGRKMRRTSSIRSNPSRRQREMDWSDEEDGSDDDDVNQFSSRRLGKPAAANTKRSGAGEYEQDEFVVDDEEGEDYGGRKGREDDRGNDSLDEADEAAERAERARKKAKKEKRAAEGSDEEEEQIQPSAAAASAMEESEDEDEGAVRRAGGGGARRARRVMAFDESDEE